MQLGILYEDATLAKVMPDVLKKLASIAQGDMPYSENVLTALTLKLSSLLAGPDYVPPKPTSESEDQWTTFRKPSNP